MRAGMESALPATRRPAERRTRPQALSNLLLFVAAPLRRFEVGKRGAIGLLATPETALDIEDGRRVYEATCANCHGPDGNSVTQGIPSIAGQPKR